MTVNASGGEGIWVVDREDDMVYAYGNATLGEPGDQAAANALGLIMNEQNDGWGAILRAASMVNRLVQLSAVSAYALVVVGLVVCCVPHVPASEKRQHAEGKWPVVTVGLAGEELEGLEGAESTLDEERKASQLPSGSVEKAEIPAGTRRFRMGFTGFVYDITPEAVMASRKFVRENGDILAHHIEGVPWAEGASGEPFPKALLEEWEGKTRW